LLLTEQVSDNRKQEGETTNKVSVMRIELAQEATRKSIVSFRKRPRACIKAKAEHF